MSQKWYRDTSYALLRWQRSAAGGFVLIAPTAHAHTAPSQAWSSSQAARCATRSDCCNSGILPAR
eukprot:12783-Heterococcus_DN1.PRE.1